MRESGALPRLPDLSLSQPSLGVNLECLDVRTGTRVRGAARKLLPALRAAGGARASPHDDRSHTEPSDRSIHYSLKPGRVAFGGH